MKITTKFTPGDPQLTDDSTTVYVNGKEVGSVSHAHRMYYPVVHHTIKKSLEFEFGPAHRTRDAAITWVVDHRSKR